MPKREFNWGLLVKVAQRVCKDKRDLSARELRDILLSAELDDEAQMRSANAVMKWCPRKVKVLFDFDGKKDWRSISRCLRTAAHSNRVDWTDAEAR